MFWCGIKGIKQTVEKWQAFLGSGDYCCLLSSAPACCHRFIPSAIVALFCSYAGAHVRLLDSAQHVPDPEVPGHLGQRDVSGWQSDAGPSGDQKVRPGVVGHGPRVGSEIFLSPVLPQL